MVLACAGVAGVAGVGGVGCYNYEPLTTPSPTPGSRLAVELTDSGTSALTGYLGPDVAQVDGRLLRVTPETLVLSAQSITNRQGINHFWTGEQVALPRNLVATLVQRRFAPARTAVFVTGAVAGVALVLRAFGVISIGGSSSMPPPTGQ